MLQCHFTVKLQKPFAEYETPNLPSAGGLDTFIVTFGWTAALNLSMELFQWNRKRNKQTNNNKKKTVSTIKQSGCDWIRVSLRRLCSLHIQWLHADFDDVFVVFYPHSLLTICFPCIFSFCLSLQSLHFSSLSHKVIKHDWRQNIAIAVKIYILYIHALSTNINLGTYYLYIKK